MAFPYTVAIVCVPISYHELSEGIEGHEKNVVPLPMESCWHLQL
jgi:hypothetical protein